MAGGNTEALYTTEDFRREVKVKDFIDRFIDVPRIKGYCRNCPRYCKVWSCPEHEFDPMLYWKIFDTFDIICRRINMPAELTDKTYSPEELEKVIDQVFFAERKNFASMLRGMEEEYSISLHAGFCDVCGKENCARREGKPCRFPKKRRYSVESLGGDVVKIADELFGIPLDWPGNGRLPKYFMLVGGLLKMK